MRSKFVLVAFLITIPLAFGDIPTDEKVNRRSYPSIAAAWSEWFVNRPQMSYSEMTAHHDMFWSPEFGLRFQRTGTDVQLVGDFFEANRQRDELLAINPNMIFILEINMRGAAPESWHLQGLYGDDFPWVGEGDVKGSTDYPDFLIDFVDPLAQEIIISQVVAVAESGLWDGIFIDFWDENGIVLEGFRAYQEEQSARTSILEGIRDRVDSDFLIIVNNTGKLTRATPYINGIFMESFRNDFSNYQHAGLIELENILSWAEDNLREPQINLLEAEGIASELPLSSQNLQSMRCLTTLLLTHSDGYFVYTMGVQYAEKHPHDNTYLEYRGEAFDRNPPYWLTHSSQHETFHHAHHHEHYWHRFWDADLGQPIGKKSQHYRDQTGIFIREFTNGWAVYNRSGKPQKILLPSKADGWYSGIKSKRWHTILDLDGEIYIKSTGLLADLNNDGVVNILDLVIVANAIGELESESDVNSDGVVNILDLVIVANDFQ